MPMEASFEMHEFPLSPLERLGEDAAKPRRIRYKALIG